MDSDSITPLDYASVLPPHGAPRRWLIAWWIVIGSLAPIPMLIVILFTSHRWSRWLQIGQRWERATGMLWIGTAVFSVACVFGLGFCRKRWDLWACMTLHVIFVALTVLPPGCIALAWLMHWLSGPGA